MPGTWRGLRAESCSHGDSLGTSSNHDNSDLSSTYLLRTRHLASMILYHQVESSAL